METELARVLNVLAHEIRTPLAVSQGNLRLMAEGRLTAVDEQAAAVARMRVALGKIATLCEDMGRLGALADAAPATLLGREPLNGVLAAVGAAATVAPTWRGAQEQGGAVATDGTPALVEAVRAVSGLAFVDAGPDATVVDVADVKDGVVTVLMGTMAAVAALPRHPEAAEAEPLSLVRGGFGVSLFVAEHVLRRHGVRSWRQAGVPGAIGLQIPVVNA